MEIVILKNLFDLEKEDEVEISVRLRKRWMKNAEREERRCLAAARVMDK
jgi:hypothetical protein